MDDVIRELLDRQARWQKGRKNLSWAEKIRMVERVREDAAKWSLSARKTTKNSSEHEI